MWKDLLILCHGNDGIRCYVYHSTRLLSWCVREWVYIHFGFKWAIVEQDIKGAWSFEIIHSNVRSFVCCCRCFFLLFGVSFKDMKRYPNGGKIEFHARAALFSESTKHMTMCWQNAHVSEKWLGKQFAANWKANKNISLISDSLRFLEWEMLQFFRHCEFHFYFHKGWYAIAYSSLRLKCIPTYDHIFSLVSI